jgi:hypothetical protein
MSTTAGVGSQDYVAINNAAIVSVILGLSTFLAFMGLPFLILGAAGIVFGIIALVQIRHSNGTQGGTGLAVLGILLSLGIAGTVSAISSMEYLATRENERAIDGVLKQMGDHLAANRYDKAWEHFSPDFQANWNANLFRDHLTAIERYLGEIEGMSSNGVFQFVTTTEGIETAQTQVVFRFKTPTTMPTTITSDSPTVPPGQVENRRVPAVLYKYQGEWRVAGMDIFPRKPGQQ